jgi:hypothetical protein
MSNITCMFLVMSSLGEVLGHPLVISGLTLLNLLDLSVHFMLFRTAVTVVCVHLLVNFCHFYIFWPYKSCGSWHFLVLATWCNGWHVTEQCVFLRMCFGVKSCSKIFGNYYCVLLYLYKSVPYIGFEREWLLLNLFASQ